MVQSLIAIGFLLATILVAVFFASIYSLKRQSYLLYWAAAWLLYAFHLLPAALSPWIAPNAFFAALSPSLFAFAGISFFLGTQVYIRQKPWFGLALTTAAILLSWSVANASQVLLVSAVMPASLLYVAVALLFWLESRNHETLSDKLLAIAFAFWGLLTLSLYGLHGAREFLGQSLQMITVIPMLFVCMLLLMANY
jgi:hypothetical protein